jgi:hypothetical protein
VIDVKRQNMRTSGAAIAVGAVVAAALVLPGWVTIPAIILAAYVIGAADGRQGRRIGRVPELVTFARMAITGTVKGQGVDR